MDYRLAAARRLMTVDAENPRARSIVSDQRPVFRFPDLTGADPALQGLAAAAGNRIGRLEVEAAPSRFLPLATAWPCAPAEGAPDTRRFVTAGHVLEVFLAERSLLSAADLSHRLMRNGRVVMPDGRILDIARWICAAPLDVAIFDVIPDGRPCPGFVPDIRGLPSTDVRVAPLGYPLQAGVRLFGPDQPGYVGRLFCGKGGIRPGSRRGYFLHDASTLPGYSGAPVFDLGTGRVLGVHVWGVAEAQDWNDAVWLSTLLRIPWLAAILAGQSDAAKPDAPTLPWMGGAPPEAAESLNPYLSSPGPEAGILRDRPDARDRLYQPGFAMPQERILPAPGMVVGDQLDEGSCAGFAVAAAVEHQLARREGYVPPTPAGSFTASVRMLDRMARRHDEWLDDDQDGTSLRAVIKGFYHNGACSSALCGYRPRQPDFFLTRRIAQDARQLTLGNYARIAHSVNDMRLAVQEAGAVLVTARVHPGWRAPPGGVIAYDPLSPAAGDALHAFVVDGYTDQGFVIQNSRGPGWGGFADLPGHALWSFEDWNDNCLDAWVIRLAPRSEPAFAVSVRSEADLATPRRIGLLGHMLHAERGGLVEDGTLGLGARGVAETAAYLAGDAARGRYDRLVLLFHEPLLDAEQIARLALPLTARLKARRAYPFHVVYGLDEMLACRLRLAHDIAEAASRYLREGDSRDVALKRLLGPSIRAQVEGYRRGARLAARGTLRDALSVLPLFAGPAADQPGLPLAMVSVGLGAVSALALAEAAPEFRGLPHLAIAAPLPVRRARAWTLAEAARDETDLPGWRGSWGDLVAVAHGRSIRSRRGAVAATVQELLARPDCASRILAELG
ncbi:Trypsin-like peptidase domain [Paracoccus aminovorans]|uniref:Trypsin-like peptidase domain n=1 Tax=Paracoccus aminovorans TaxID=34004 RepID=A0A1I3C6N6_9RHOB|nr:trypsin-like peptidase domain-containing protein [Paracoccus aminovorans]CQR84481.1 hypothetical protein JCM7685_pAMV3p0536 [Paracoccus aminovorans]SFH69996.1 Trypsin-like peptidase domain [Paracoccus aminovorans]